MTNIPTVVNLPTIVFENLSEDDLKYFEEKAKKTKREEAKEKSLAQLELLRDAVIYKLKHVPLEVQAYDHAMSCVS